MRRAAVAVVCVLALSSAGTRALAAPPEDAAPGGWRLGVGPVIGGLVFDPDLANYHWDTHPAVQSGLQTTLYRSRLAAGARLVLAHTTQASGIPGETESPQVNLSGLSVVGEGRVVSYRGVSLWGTARAGRLFFGYDPDQLTFDPGGAGAPITVEFAPIAEWDYGLGIELQGDLTRQLALALQAERSTFALDTAHRRGGEIVESRERFYSWELRLHLSWLVSLN